MKIRYTTIFPRGLTKTLFLIIGGLGIFALFLLGGIYTIRAGGKVLGVCDPFYNTIFLATYSVGSLLSSISGIVIPVCAMSAIALGGFLLLKSPPENRPRTIIISSLGFIILSYWLFLKGFWIFGLFSCLIAATGMGIAVVVSPLSHPKNSGGDRATRKIWLILILTLALVSCFYNLENHPYCLSGWEVSSGISALQIIHRIDPGYAKSLWLPLQRSMGSSASCPFFVFPLCIVLKIFGTSILVIRSFGVLWGMISLVILYRIIKDLFGQRTALITIFLTSISPWFLSIARYGGYISQSLCYFLLVALFFLRGARKGKQWDFFIAGVLSGLYSYFYLPVKIILPLLILCWLHNLRFACFPIRKKLLWGIVFLAGFFLVCQFQGNPYLKLNGAITNQGFLGSPPLKSGFNLSMAVIDLKINFNRLFYNLFYRSHNFEFPAPNTLLVGRGILALSILGFGICVSRWKQFSCFFLALAAVLMTAPIMIISSQLGEQQFARRAFLMAVILPSLAAITLNTILNFFARPGERKKRLLVLTGIALWISATGALGLTRYFNSVVWYIDASQRILAEQCIDLIDNGYRVEISHVNKLDPHLKELLDFLSYQKTQQLYTNHPYMGLPGNRKKGGMYCQTIAENPYFRFFYLASLGETLRDTASFKRKTAIIIDNVFPCEGRSALMEITSFDPKARIETIKDNEGAMIGFKCMLSEKSEKD